MGKTSIFGGQRPLFADQRHHVCCPKMPRFRRLDLHGTFSGGLQATAAASKRGGEVKFSEMISAPEIDELDTWEITLW